MISQFAKGAKEILSVNYDSSDFDCRCNYLSCLTTYIDTDLVAALDTLLSMSGEFKINSGYRCTRHNADVGGEKNSQHLLGKAVDIESTVGLTGADLSKFVLQIPLLENGGLGIAEHWLHTDVRGNRARWTYPIRTLH